MKLMQFILIGVLSGSCLSLQAQTSSKEKPCTSRTCQIENEIHGHQAKESKPLPIDQVKTYCTNDKVESACRLYLQMVEDQERNVRAKGVDPEQCNRQTNETERKACFDSLPPECRMNQPSFDQKRCVDYMFAVTFGDILGSKKPIDSDALAQAHRDICQALGTEITCSRSITSYFQKKDYAKALETMQIACNKGLKNECKKIQTYQSVQPIRDLLQKGGMNTEQIPCGSFYLPESQANAPDYVFGDGGIVSMPLARMRARIEDGDLRMRHDKNGDFVFRKLNDQYWLGVDTWYEGQLFRYQPSGKACTPSKPYVIKPLPTQDQCAGLLEQSVSKIQQCCQQGSVLSCNRLGHTLVLKKQALQAMPYYAKVCEANHIEGCENMITVVKQTQIQQLQAIQALCQKDPLSAACATLEATQVEALQAEIELKAILEQEEQEEQKQKQDSKQQPKKRKKIP